jgi:hypothetical protein
MLIYNMGATTITGVSGPGMSGGMTKPGNSVGCGCHGKPGTVVPATTSPQVCYTSIKVGQNISVRVGGSLGIKTCN